MMMYVCMYVCSLCMYVRTYVRIGPRAATVHHYSMSMRLFICCDMAMVENIDLARAVGKIPLFILSFYLQLPACIFTIYFPSKFLFLFCFWVFSPSKLTLHSEVAPRNCLYANLESFYMMLSI